MVTKKKKIYLKKWIESILILVNIFIFSFLCMINNFNFKGFLIILILLLVFGFNALIIGKYGRTFKSIKKDI